MASLSGFNASEVPPEAPREPLPAGKYIAVIESSEMIATKSGTGEYLSLTLRVVGGPYDGRTLYDRLNLTNPSEQAVAIARARLSSICRAVDVLRPSDSVELHGRPLSVSVRHEVGADGKTRAVVAGYERATSVAPPRTTTSAPTKPSTPPANQGAPPWRK